MHVLVRFDLNGKYGIEVVFFGDCWREVRIAVLIVLARGPIPFDKDFVGTNHRTVIEEFDAIGSVGRNERRGFGPLRGAEPNFSARHRHPIESDFSTHPGTGWSGGGATSASSCHR